jgi:hypothetical protein
MSTVKVHASEHAGLFTRAVMLVVVEPLLARSLVVGSWHCFSQLLPTTVAQTCDVYSGSQIVRDSIKCDR